jgi:hypothetical protein
MPKGLHLAKIEPYAIATPKAVYNLKVYMISMMGCAAALNYGYDLGFIVRPVYSHELRSYS